MAMKSLDTLLLDELKDLYDAEHQITEALPMLMDAASDRRLKSALQEHLRVTGRQIKRLDQIFQQLGKEPSRKLCKGMQGIIKEGQSMMKEGEGSPTLDAALIASAQKVEHYEIASYGSVRTWADQLGLRDISDLLQQTLDEEGQTDHHLTSIAKEINPKAQQQA